VANFYPKISAHAGQRKTPEGIEMMFLLAIYDYAGSYPEAVTAVLQVATPRFVQVLTEASTPAGDDPEPSPFPVPARASDGLPQGGGTGPRGASMNNGPSFSNGPEFPPLLRNLPRMNVTRFELMEGDRIG
jgi:hypothetical protein